MNTTPKPSAVRAVLLPLLLLAAAPALGHTQAGSAIALSAVLLGTMVALAVRPPLWAAALLVGCFAIFHAVRCTVRRSAWR